MTTTGSKWSWITVTSDGRSSWLLQVVNIGGTKDDVRDVVRTFGSTVCSLQHDHKKTNYAFCIVLLLWRSCTQVESHNTWAIQNSKVKESVTGHFDTSRFDTNLSSKLHVLFQNSLRMNKKNIFCKFSSFFKPRAWNYFQLEWVNLYPKAL